MEMLRVFFHDELFASCRRGQLLSIG